MSKIYDMIIIGGGPAGLTAAVYALQSGRSVLLVEKAFVGGQIIQATELTNYPGIKKTDGATFAMDLFEQATDLGLETVYEEVVSIADAEKDVKVVLTYEGSFKTKTIVLAMGAVARKLGIPGEEELIGKGVGYCATCDGTLYKKKTVAVVGGGNTAIEDVQYLSNLCKKVYLIHYKDELKAHEKDVAAVKKLPKTKLEFLLNYKVEELLKDKKLTGVKLVNVKNGRHKTLSLDGLFIAAGRTPDAKAVSKLVDIDKNGYIITDEKMATNLPGIFAAGDIRPKMLRQVVTACSDGAIAATSANIYIKINKL